MERLLRAHEHAYRRGTAGRAKLLHTAMATDAARTADVHLHPPVDAKAWARMSKATARCMRVGQLLTHHARAARRNGSSFVRAVEHLTTLPCPVCNDVPARGTRGGDESIACPHCGSVTPRDLGAATSSIARRDGVFMVEARAALPLLHEVAAPPSSAL